MRLAHDADAIIDNLRPGVLKSLAGHRLRVDQGHQPADTASTCAISGYGSDGPYSERPGYDTIGQAMGGLLGVLTDREHPSGVGASLSDHLTGTYWCYAVQAALFGLDALVAVRRSRRRCCKQRCRSLPKTRCATWRRE